MTSPDEFFAHPPAWLAPYAGWLPYVWDVVLVLSSALLGRAIAVLTLRALAAWSARTQTELDDSVALHLRAPLRWLFPSVALNFALPQLLALSPLRASLVQLSVAATILCCGWTTNALFAVLEDAVNGAYRQADGDPARLRAVQTRTAVFRNVGSYVVVVVTVGFVLMSFEAVRQVGAGILASAGLIGVVAGFAAQKSLGSVLSGLQIALTQPIKVDDIVIVEGEQGVIEEITLTYVVVRIWDKRRLVLPINHFIEKPVQNWTRGSADLLGTVELPLDHTAPIDDLRAELRRICEGSPLWDGASCRIQITAASERTITVRALVSAKNSSDLWDLRCEVREQLVRWMAAHRPESLPRLRADDSVRD